MTRLVITPRAARDIEEIGDYIAQDNPPRALSFVMDLRAHCRKIAASPQLYRLRPELGPDIRSCVHGHYVIYFREDEQNLIVIRVLHGARDAGAQLQPVKE